MSSGVLYALGAAAALLAAPARSESPIFILDRRALVIERSAATPSHRLDLVLAYFEGDWRPEQIGAALRRSAQVLAQCGVDIASADLVRIEAPARFRVFDTRRSRVLAGTLALSRPTIYFVGDTRRQPAFEAEAIGRVNSGSRPELRDSVWVARGARDLDIVLAHELAHVLMDSGGHSTEPDNLMREQTAPQNTRLSDAQCARLRETATANGLLRPVR